MERRFSRPVAIELAREPREVAMALLPRHRALRLWLVHHGDAPVRLGRRDVRLVDERGSDLRAALTPDPLELPPGEERSLDVVYVVREGTAPPARLEHAGGVVELAPTSARRA